MFAKKSIEDISEEEIRSQLFKGVLLVAADLSLVNVRELSLHKKLANTKGLVAICRCNSISFPDMGRANCCEQKYVEIMKRVVGCCWR
ncbi:hypothetical protein SUGI_0840100 [Cryptomeria japonica]|nr:hypothetical protein SUGI_0840100 [Cryptomeria japonica]